MQKELERLREYAEEVYSLGSVRSLLSWDQSTYMPTMSVDARGRQLALIGRLQQEAATKPELGELLEKLEPYVAKLPYDSEDASLVRVMKREYNKNLQVPPKFISKLYSHIAKTQKIWEEARAEDNFKKIEPYLTETLELSKEYANFFPGYKHIADPLIDDIDPGMQAAEIRELFTDLRDKLVPLVDEVLARGEVDDSFLKQFFPKDKQLAFGEGVIRRLGFDFKRGRQDLTAHPFMIKMAYGDIRITTRVNENNLNEALFSSIHETGHALYELGIAPELEGTSLHEGASMGVHESQSRLWENLVGRSYRFWQYFYPELKSTFPSQLKDISLEQFYKAINKVSRSLIRTDADELTYNLHVIIRFDLELAMLEGNLQVKDLPAAWRDRYQNDLGVSSPDDKDGVLQDVHWYSGLIGGSFQCYTLGNILSSQFYNAALEAHPEIPQEVTQGKFSILHNWLKYNIYRHGNKFTANELVEKVTGSELTTDPYIEYLTNKFVNIS